MLFATFYFGLRHALDWLGGGDVSGFPIFWRQTWKRSRIS